MLTATLNRRKIAVTSLCMAAPVPATIALRWTKSLTNSSLLRLWAAAQVLVARRDQAQQLAVDPDARAS